MTAATGLSHLDRLRCQLALGGVEEITPVELWRLCREGGVPPAEAPAAAGERYTALLASGEVVPVDTPFGPRLAVTGALVDAAERALRASTPSRATAGHEGELFAAPTLIHDLVTLAAFVRREQPRVTGRGLLAAPALRRLEGLTLTPEAVAPTMDRRALAGTHVWQFLFRFLCEEGLVRLDGGRATAAEGAADSVAARSREFAALLFTFAASRRPVGDSGWLCALEGPLPATWEKRRLLAWLTDVGARSPEAALERTTALLEAVGFARAVGSRLVLLPAAQALWRAPGDVLTAAGPERAAAAVPVTVSLPGGGVAVDLASGEAALAARLALERETSPESVGHIVVYGAQAPHRLADGEPPLKVRHAAVVRGDDDAMLAAVAEAMAGAVVARWPGGLAVEVLAMDEAVERLTRLGGRVEREAPWADGARSGGAAAPGRAAALPWTLPRAREGAWAHDSAGTFRPLRAPAAMSPAAAQALPTIGARLRAAARLGWPVRLSLDGCPPRLGLVADVRWEAGDERVEVLWLEGEREEDVVALPTVLGAALVGGEAADEADARA